jgi:hypothetical protein
MPDKEADAILAAATRVREFIADEAEQRQQGAYYGMPKYIESAQSALADADKIARYLASDTKVRP